MVTAHRNEGIAPLDTQLKAKYPGIVIGWIGDPAHQERKSAHNPNSAGRVNAIDPMIGPHFTWADAVWLAATLSHYADKRLNNIIFNKRIWDDANGGWRNYDGDDPHTNHLHIEVHDMAYQNPRPWNLGSSNEGEDVSPENIDAIANLVVKKLVTQTKFTDKDGGQGSAISQAVMNGDYPVKSGAKRTHIWQNLQSIHNMLDKIYAAVAAPK